MTNTYLSNGRAQTELDLNTAITRNGERLARRCFGQLLGKWSVEGDSMFFEVESGPDLQLIGYSIDGVPQDLAAMKVRGVVCPDLLNTAFPKGVTTEDKIIAVEGDTYKSKAVGFANAQVEVWTRAR